MKRFILVFATIALSAGVLQARGSGKAIGLRLGYDAQEISYQQPFNDANRLELTLGVNTFGFNMAGKHCRGAGLNGIYQWVYNLSSGSDKLKGYVGAGAAVLDHGLFGAGVLGQVGVEYNFDSPVQLSLDYRPGAYWLPGAGNVYRFSWNTPCLSVRFHF
ncbi:MAG: hypothetical protein Q8904_08190 [Bacteroidota bacterium]|nr:hypothetical protein [Bacteroidota bacterium]